MVLKKAQKSEKNDLRVIKNRFHGHQNSRDFRVSFRTCVSMSATNNTAPTHTSLLLQLRTTTTTTTTASLLRIFVLVYH